MKKLISIVIIVSVVLFTIIASSLLLQSLDDISTVEKRVMEIAVAYIEENYGTDYTINGEVTNQSYKEHSWAGVSVYEYPTASFRIPSDYFESGQIVNVMVDPDTDEIVKVISNPSKAFPAIGINLSSSWETEVRKGESTSKQITLTSIYPEELNITFSLKSMAYNYMPVPSNYTFPFEAVFEPEILVLSRHESQSVNVTLTANYDAPLGAYTMTMSASDGNKGVAMQLTITVIE